MTSRYITLIQQTLELKYPQKQHQQHLVLQNIKFKLFLPKTSLILSSYQQLKTLSITHCDIRNLQNFPKLYYLEELNLGFNQIQGTFNYLIPSKRLKYLNIQDNIVFESNKLAPLKKIALATRSGQQLSTKLSICLRNNPFTNEESSYINKLKGYGLRIVKEPKEYFDKKKNDDQKVNKTRRQLSGGNKKNGRVVHKKEKKLKKIQHEEIDSFYSEESRSSSLSSSSSSSDDDNNPNPNQANINNEPAARTYNRMSSRMGLESEIQSRMAVRLSRQRSLQFRNMVDNPFMDSDELGEGGLLVLEDSENSEVNNGDRFGGAGEQNAEDRLRVLQERRARFQELRQIRRDQLLQRQRIQQLRQRQRREQLLRQRHARQLQIVRQLEQDRQRLLSRPSVFMREYNNNPSSIFGAMINNASNTSALQEDWRANPFRRRPSGASGSALGSRIDAVNSGVNSGVNNGNSNSNAVGNINGNSIGSMLSRNESSNSLGRYRSYMQHMRAIERNISINSSDSSLMSPAYQPLRAPQSFIRISRQQSYHSAQSNALIIQRQQQINRDSQGIRFQINDDSVSDDNDNDLDNDQQQQQNDDNEMNDDDDDDDEIDELLQDDIDQQQEDNEMIHACHEGCEHNAGQEDDDDEQQQEEQEQQQQEQDNQQDLQNKDEEQDEQDQNNQQQDIFASLQQRHQNNPLLNYSDANDDFDDFMMINDQIIQLEPVNNSSNLALERPLGRQININQDDRNPESSNLNPDSSSNIQDDESSQSISQSL